MVVFNGVFPGFFVKVWLDKNKMSWWGLAQEIWIFLQNYKKWGKQV